MFGVCGKCGFTKELTKRMEFCPKCGTFLKPDPNVKGSTSSKGMTLKEEYAEKKETVSVISKDLTETWRKKMKYRRKAKHSDQMSRSYAV